MFDSPSLPLGFGTSKLCSVNGGLSSVAARRLLEAAFDAGIRFIDTAPSYGQGQAESAIGSLPERLKDEIFLCSKVGYNYGRKALLINAIKPILRRAAKSLAMFRRVVQKSREGMQRHGGISVDIQPESIRASLAGSLRRLRRDRLDLLLLHDASLQSLNERNRLVLDSLVSEGAIGHWGVSTADATVAHRAVDLRNLGFLQVPVEPAWVNEAGDLFRKCYDRGITVIANRVLSPTRTDGISPLPKEEAGRIVEQCFSFALQQPAVRVVLCGTTSNTHLQENVSAMKRLQQSLCGVKREQP